MTESTTRRQNAALTAAATAALEELKEVLPFAEDREAARFAFAYAMSSGASPKRPAELGSTHGGINWAVSSLDPDGDLARLVELTWPDERDPHYVIETLMNVGMLALAERVRADPSLRFADLLSDEPEPDASGQEP